MLVILWQLSDIGIVLLDGVEIREVKSMKIRPREFLTLWPMIKEYIASKKSDGNMNFLSKGF